MSINITQRNNNNAIVSSINSSLNLEDRSAKSYREPRNYKALSIVFGTIFLLLSAAIGAYILNPAFETYRAEQLATPLGQAITVIASTILVLELSMFAYFVILYFKYKPVASVTDEELPTATVIVPAYNEGELVYHTLISLANSEYPAEKLQILAIDDGSKDDTWIWMQKAKNVLGERIDIYQQPQNQGKRHALYRGFQLGTGEVFVTVDSDSVVDPDTMRNLVSPFVTNPKCGAVAGNVRVLNDKTAILPKMLNVSFAFSFEFVRSSQSTIGSVFCTPGALAAYRKDAVMNCLEAWINQKFMGKPSDIGEDRAITNMILKQGLEVRFQKNANVYTNTPEEYRGLTKMFTRWERSNVRENLAMSQFAFKNFRDGAKSGTRIILLQQWLRMAMAIPAIFMMLYFVITAPVLFLTSALTGILIFSSIQFFFFAAKRNFKDAVWAYTYSILYTFGLFWITPYALITAGKGGWLTREIKPQG